MKQKDIQEINNTTWVRKTTILCSFFFGWILTFAGFCVPPTGVIDNTVLVVLGQALTYSAVGVGLKQYGEIQDRKIDEIIKKQYNTKNEDNKEL